MPNHRPLTAKVVERLVDVQVLLYRAVTADGVICPAERRVIRALREATDKAERADQARIEAIYALNNGLPDPPSAWHARKRRELTYRTTNDAGRSERPTSS